MLFRDEELPGVDPVQRISLVPDIQIVLPARLGHGVDARGHLCGHGRRVELNQRGNRVELGFVLKTNIVLLLQLKKLRREEALEKIGSTYG